MFLETLKFTTGFTHLGTFFAVDLGSGCSHGQSLWPKLALWEHPPSSPV